MELVAKESPSKKQQGELDLQYWTNINEPGSRNAVHSHQAIQYD